MTQAKLPYLFELESDGQDIHFKRVTNQSSSLLPWGLHSDFDQDNVNVLIFVRVDTDKTEIMDAINEAQTYWREQTEHA